MIERFILVKNNLRTYPKIAPAAVLRVAYSKSAAAISLTIPAPRTAQGAF